MEVVPENGIEIKSSESFNLSHHFVTKAESTTTKLLYKQNIRVTYLTFFFDFALTSLFLVPI